MNEAEQQAFLQEPFAEDAIKLRRWDDEGKVEELSNRTVADYVEQMRASLRDAVVV